MRVDSLKKGRIIKGAKQLNLLVLAQHFKSGFESSY